MGAPSADPTASAGASPSMFRLNKVYENIRDGRLRTGLPDHGGSIAFTDGNLEWYRKVRNHLIGLHRDIRAILDFVEMHRDPIADAHISVNFGRATDIDCAELASAMWSMLNQVLTGKAHSILTNTREGSGLDV